MPRCGPSLSYAPAYSSPRPESLPSTWRTAVASGVIGIGVDLAYAAMSSLIVHNVVPHETGVDTGMNTNIGGAIGTAIVSSIVTCRLRADGLAAESGYTHGFTLPAVISVVAIGSPFSSPPDTAAPAQQSASAVHPSRKRNGLRARVGLGPQLGLR
jgi:hypothetical protein